MTRSQIEGRKRFLDRKIAEADQALADHRQGLYRFPKVLINAFKGEITDHTRSWLWAAFRGRPPEVDGRAYPYGFVMKYPDHAAYAEIEAWFEDRVKRDEWVYFDDAPIITIIAIRDRIVATEFRMRWC